MSRGDWKFLYAFLVPALLVLAVITGNDSSTGYTLIATLLTLAGAICLAGVVPKSSNRVVVGITYFVVLEFALVFLP